jgi:hypothetical protein
MRQIREASGSALQCQQTVRDGGSRRAFPPAACAIGNCHNGIFHNVIVRDFQQFSRRIYGQPAVAGGVQVALPSHRDRRPSAAWPERQMYAFAHGEAYGTESGGGRRSVSARRPARPVALTVREPVEPAAEIVYLDDSSAFPAHGEDEFDVVFASPER